MENVKSKNNGQIFWWGLIAALVLIISVLHYTTSTMKWQYHLIYMQAYFIPILIAAFQFGIKGGLGTAIAVSIIYFPHVMLQWGGLIENNLMRFLQIVLFNTIGFLTGLKSQAEKSEKERYQQAAVELQRSFNQLQRQSEQLSDLENQLRLADRLSVVGELAASLAHEVRNPLGSIRGTTEILRDELPKETKESEFFQILIQETTRLSEVLENYLSFARKQKQEQSEYDFNEAVRSVIQLLGHEARKSNIQFVVQLQDNSVKLKGDPNHLRQILVNLLLNSIQAMPRGGKISILSQLCSDEQKNQIPKILELELQDEGTGIAPEVMEQIFLPFYTTKPNGTGLGLAIVKRLADENHWQLRIESEVGKGSRFKLIIPVD